MNPSFQHNCGVFGFFSSICVVIFFFPQKPPHQNLTLSGLLIRLLRQKTLERKKLCNFSSIMINKYSSRQKKRLFMSVSAFIFALKLFIHTLVN